ncbi:hypothetical protein DVH05_005552 [Phytophthora capsici]|nr:hypothetical protein DVH05_005552 [Phytophthora capsici]
MDQPPLMLASPTLFASFDGGYRATNDRCSYAWCVWTDSHTLLRWEARTLLNARTNNVMEAQGLFACLLWIRSVFPAGRATVFGDSTIAINQALMLNRCQEPSLRPWVGAIRALGTGRPAFYLQHVHRAYNTAPDALCNWMMDTLPASDVVLMGSEWPCPSSYAPAQSPAALTQFHPSGDSVVANTWFHASAAWSLVLQEFQSVSHLIRLRFAPISADRPSHPAVRLPHPPQRVTTSARSMQSRFDTY